MNTKMPNSRAPSPSSTDFVDAAYRLLANMPDEISTLDLYVTDPEQYALYCQWYEQREDSQRLSRSTLPLASRLAAYLRLIATQGRKFQLGTNKIPSSRWLRERLDIHRNTMSKYINDAQNNRPVKLSLTVGSQLALAAAIYPPEIKREKDDRSHTLNSRLDLIDDFHLTGKNKTKMVQSLMPIIYTGNNNLFTVPKTYPCVYDLDPKGNPVKRMSEHTARKRTRRVKRLAK